MVSTYKAHIFKRSQTGDREEVKLKVFAPDGSPINLGGGGSEGVEWTFRGGASAPDPGVENSGFNVVLEYDPPIPLAPAGSYLAKLGVTWGVGTPSSGEAVAQLMHIDADEIPHIVCEIRLNTEYETTGYGDAQFGPNGIWTKRDFEILNDDGRFEVWVYQTTDQHPTPAFVDLQIVKL